MDTPRRQSWVFGALVVGVMYLLIGIVFAVPSTHVRAWRLAAWIVSAVVYGAHITYECVQARNAPRAVALHAAFAAALGAFGLAVVGALHSLWTISSVRPVWFLAFVLWPIITGLPAFVVAFGAASALTRFLRKTVATQLSTKDAGQARRTGDGMDETIHNAAMQGDAERVRRLLAADPALATRTDAVKGWDPLTHLCFSEYLRQDRSRARGFLEAARALLDAGASANTGFDLNDEFESVLYGAAGIAHDVALTRLLVERGADPNDGEVVYHAPETRDNAVLQALIETGRLTADSLATMLVRKCDWHDHDGVALLLEHGADPNRTTRWGYTALHQAIRRDNSIETISLLLDHGADPSILAHGKSATAMAAWEGRGDVLHLFQKRRVSLDLNPVERLLAACATNDADAVRRLGGDSTAVRDILGQQGAVLGEFAGIGNTAGIRHLLSLGADVAAIVSAGDGYWGIAKNSMALHVAAWRGRHATVKFLIDHGAPLDVPDGNGRTPLMLAARACVDSYWKERRSPESVAALVAAGASIDGVSVPTGYDAIDVLLVRAKR